jgi:fumiquinazoline A oxidase
LEPFKKLGPTNITVQSGPQSLLFPPILGSCTPNQHINIYSVALTHTDPNTFDSVFQEMDNFWQQHSDYQGRLLIQRFPNDAVVAVPDNETAYPWRNAVAHV